MSAQPKSALFWSAAIGLPASAAALGFVYYWQSSGYQVTPKEQRDRSANYGTFLKREQLQKASNGENSRFRCSTGWPPAGSSSCDGARWH